MSERELNRVEVLAQVDDGRLSVDNAEHMLGPTQFGRALAELNIEIICANSSQAKGHVESARQTLCH